MSTTNIQADEQFIEGLIPRIVKVFTPGERHRLYITGIVLGSLLFTAWLVWTVLHGFNVVGAPSLDGWAINPETGVLGLILSAISYVARVHLTTASGVIDALEDIDPKAVPVVDKVEAAAPTVEADVKAAEPVVTAAVDAVVPAAAPVVAKVEQVVNEVPAVVSTAVATSGVPATSTIPGLATPSSPSSPTVPGATA